MTVWNVPAVPIDWQEARRAIGWDARATPLSRSGSCALVRLAPAGMIRDILQAGRHGCRNGGGGLAVGHRCVLRLRGGLRGVIVGVFVVESVHCPIMRKTTDKAILSAIIQGRQAVRCLSKSVA